MLFAGCQSVWSPAVAWSADDSSVPRDAPEPVIRSWVTVGGSAMVGGRVLGARWR